MGMAKTRHPGARAVRADLVACENFLVSASARPTRSSDLTKDIRSPQKLNAEPAEGEYQARLRGSELGAVCHKGEH